MKGETCLKSEWKKKGRLKKGKERRLVTDSIRRTLGISSAFAIFKKLFKLFTLFILD